MQKINEISKSDKRKFLVIVIAGAAVVVGAIALSYAALYTLGYAMQYFFLSSVPENPNFSIPSDLGPKEVIPTNLGGTNYSELVFERSQDKQEWLVPCYEAFTVDDAEDVCWGFVRGYLRRYSVYALSDGTGLKGIEPPDSSVMVPNGLTLHVIEYDTANSAKSACSFLRIDVSYPIVEINGVDILASESEGGFWTHYVLLTDKFVISVRGSYIAARDAIGKITKLYKKT